jgi:hypothetical protein
MNHKWTECDDLVALYLYQHGTLQIGLSIDYIARQLGIGVSSMKMRVRNFKSVDGGGGLSNVAAQSRSVFAKFSGLSEPELRARVLNCLK